MIPREPSNQTIWARSDRPPSRTTSSWWGSRQTWWAWIAVLLPVAVFTFVWSCYAVNVPKWDDHALRAFLYYSDQETTYSGKLYQLFKQHNEHRIVYDRIVTLINFHLFGKLDFRHLMIVGNLSLVGLLAVFVSVLHRANRTVLYAVPVAFLLFNLSQWENMFWGMAALQNFSVVLWVVAAFYWLTYTNRWGLALAAAILATLTSGNGLLVWPIGFVLLTLRVSDPRLGSAYQSTKKPLRTRQPFWLPFTWVLVAAIVIGLYFLGFEKPAGNPPARGSITDLLKGWLAFVGAAAEALPVGSALRTSLLLGGLMAVLALGLITWGLFSHRRMVSQAFRRLLPSKQSAGSWGLAVPPLTLFFWGGVAFILGTAAVVAWARTSFGADLLITSRYKIYSLTLLALLYTYVVVTVDGRAGRWVMLGGVVGSLGFAGLSYLSFLDETIWWRHWLTTNQFNWTHSTDSPIVTVDPITQRYTDQASAFYETTLPTIYGPAQQSLIPLTITKTPNGFRLQESSLPPFGLRDEGAYVLARSSKRTYLFPVWQNQRSLFQARFMPSRLFSAGFRADVLTSELEAGTYQVFLLTISANGQSALHPTNQTITSVGQPIDTTQKNW